MERNYKEIILAGEIVDRGGRWQGNVIRSQNHVLSPRGSIKCLNSTYDRHPFKIIDYGKEV